MQGNLARVEALRVLDGHLDGTAEDLALTVANSFLLSAVVDLFEHARDCEQGSGLERGEIVEEVLRIGGETCRAPAHDGDERDVACEHVRERKEHQQARARGHNRLTQKAHCVEGLIHEVCVRELHALGPAGRAGGVDDRRGV